MDNRPIDGTVNFANGIPICCVSIGLEVSGVVEMGAVYNPLFNEFFFGQRGFGSTLNNEHIHVSNKSEVIKSCLVTGFPYTYLDKPNGPLEVFSKLIRNGVPVLVWEVRRLICVGLLQEDLTVFMNINCMRGTVLPVL
jgi:myo-inositol-1(or 4)-monophosphatase